MHLTVGRKLAIGCYNQCLVSCLRRPSVLVPELRESVWPAGPVIGEFMGHYEKPKWAMQVLPAGV